MSRVKKLSYTLRHCQHHIVWISKYRFCILNKAVGEEVEYCIRTFSERKGCDILALNIYRDHIHLAVIVPPEISISDFGIIKGRTTICHDYLVLFFSYQT